METEDKQTIEPAFGELHRAFLEEWPVERVALMTLDEYSNRELTSFTYWIEFKTCEIGSIKGGSSLKFKVYSRKARSHEPPREGWETDGIYAWHSSLGHSAEAAFERVRPEILKLVRAAGEMDFEAIESADFFGQAIYRFHS